MTADPSGRATFSLVSKHLDMKLDPETLLWNGRTKEVRQFRIEGAKGLEHGTFAVEKSSLLDIRSVRAKIRRNGKDWNEAELDMHEATQWPGFDSFNDLYLRVYTIRQLRIGDEVEVEIETQHKVAWEIPQQVFGGRDPILRQVYEVRLPISIVPAVSARPGLLDWRMPQATSSRDGDKLVLRWEAQDLPGLGDPEPESPGFQDLLPTIRVTASRFALGGVDTVSVRRSWRDFASWYDARTRPLLQLDPRLRAYVTEAGTTTSGHARLVDRFFAYVQARVRYLAVSIGEGGWVPHAAPVTYAAGYGDCKDMSTLLVALLRESGVPAHLALVRTRGSGLVDTSFAYSMQFNHCVAYVPDPSGDWWLDATSGFLHAGEITPHITRNPALVLDGASTRFLMPAPRPSAENARSARFQLGATQAGRAPLQFKLSAQGVLAPAWRQALEQASPEGRLQLLGGELGRYFDTVAGVEVDSLRLESNRPTVVGHCNVASPVQTSAGRWLVMRGVTRLPMVRGLDSRLNPIEIGPPRHLRVEFIFPAPEKTLPDSAEIFVGGDFASFRARTTARGGHWICRRDVTWKAEMVPVAKVREFAEFTRKVQRVNDEVLWAAERQ